jgi:flagellar protein FlbT
MVVSMRSGERIYINGAVFKVDRKVSIEILNDVSFLLEAHVMQPEDTFTPLRQFYFVIQTMMIDPEKLDLARGYLDGQYTDLLRNYSDLEIIDGLRLAKTLALAGRYYEALKQVRLLFPIEDAILAPAARHAPSDGIRDGCIARILSSGPVNGSRKRKLTMPSIGNQTPAN